MAASEGKPQRRVGVRRVAAAVMVVWGALLVVFSALGTPKARAAQRLMDGARPLVAPAYLARERALVAEGRAALQELDQTALPRLAATMHESDAQLLASYPDVAAGVHAMPTIFDTTDTSLANLQEHHEDFRDADNFPMPHVSRLAASIGGIVFGLLLIGLGALSWQREWRWPAATGLGLALLAALLPLAFWLPGKARGLADMAASLNLTKETAATTRASFTTVNRFTQQLQGQLVPDAASAAGTTIEAIQVDVLQGLDHLQAAVRDYPTTVRLFAPDVRLRETAYHDFQSVKGVPVVALVWIFISGNLLVAVAAGASSWVTRRRRL